jgi:hypothetical protein
VLPGIAVLFTALSIGRAVTFQPEADHMSSAVARLVTQLPALREPVLASSTVDAHLAFGGAFDGLEALVLDLEKRGVETVVDPRLADRFGPRRAERKRAHGREVILVNADGNDKPPGFRSIGLVDPLPPNLRDERNDLLDELDLPHSASARRIILSVHGRSSRQRIADRLLHIPDLPRVELLLSPNAPS